MPFQKGEVSNPKGRPVGAKGKNVGLVKAQLQELDCDPILELVLIARDINTEPVYRIKIYSELANYIHPKLKAIEHTGVDILPTQNKYLVEIVDAPLSDQNNGKEIMVEG